MHCFGWTHALPPAPTLTIGAWFFACCVVIITELLLVTSVCNSPVVRDFALWGKNKEWSVSDESVPLVIKMLNVPKCWFSHFYIVGAAWHALLLSVYTLYGHNDSGLPRSEFPFCLFEQGQTAHFSRESAMFALALLTVQTTRRAWESVYMTVSSEAQMHVSQYLVGLAFYIGTGLAVVAESPLFSNGPRCSAHHGYSSQLMISRMTSHTTGIHQDDASSWAWRFVGGLLFLWASIHQHRCHAILYRLRADPGSHAKMRYSVPYGDWFSYVSSPHYLAEIIIYVGIGLTMRLQCYAWFLIVTFVAANLGWGAVRTHEWYSKKFKGYPRGRRAIIPLLL